jgi:cytochrome c biogenesis protein CcmG/thiol:disulfide interchange protein DsbE
MARQTKSQRREQKQAELEQQRKEAAQKKTMRAVAIGLTSVVVLAALIFAVWPRQSDAEIAAEAASNTTATAWDLPQLDGDGRVALADFHGKPTVAAFFASWCEVCEVEMPELLALSAEVGDNINFVGIDMMDNGRGLGDAEKWGLAGNWPLAVDIGNGNGSSLSALTFGARGSPLNVLYSPDGEVLHVQLGAISRSQILSEFSPYLQG